MLKSCETGFEKLEKNLLDKTIITSGFHKSEILFCDDKKEYIEGKKYGFEVYL